MLRRQNHVLSQTTTPFTCTLVMQENIGLIFRSLRNLCKRRALDRPQMSSLTKYLAIPSASHRGAKVVDLLRGGNATPL